MENRNVNASSSEEQCDPSFMACDFDLCNRGRNDVDDSVAPMNSDSKISTPDSPVAPVAPVAPDAQVNAKVDSPITEDPEDPFEDLEELPVAKSNDASKPVVENENQSNLDEENADDSMSASGETFDEKENLQNPNGRRNKILVWITLLALIAIVVLGVAFGTRFDKEETKTDLAQASDGSTTAPPDVDETPTVTQDDTQPSEPANGQDDTKPSEPADGQDDTQPDPSDDPVGDFIRTLGIFGGEEFSDENSYQSKALSWVKEDAVASKSRSYYDPPTRWSEIRLKQRYALASFYYSTFKVEHIHTEEHFDGNVGPWLNSTNWMTRGSECEWFGVVCDDITVTGLNMTRNDLSGELPREITLLSELSSLDISRNGVFNYGKKGNDWLGDMSSMKYLYYSETYFDYDGIPSSISKLTDLREYDCSYTLYFGPLKGEVFEGLNNLEYLDISGNEYDGPIPTAVVTLPSLKYLYVQDTSITGKLDFFTESQNEMAPLREFWADNNMISGTIPPAIGSVVTLVSLSLSGNQLMGAIPAEIGQLTGLVQMWLYDNKLTGPIPLAVSSLSNLGVFITTGNELTGSA